jgi:hypothetical protein
MSAWNDNQLVDFVDAMEELLREIYAYLAFVDELHEED